MIQTCGCADSSLPNNGLALYNGSYPYCNLTDMTQSKIVTSHDIDVYSQSRQHFVKHFNFISHVVADDCGYNLTQLFVQNQLNCNCPPACE
jgi:hypothetical protein